MPRLEPVKLFADTTRGVITDIDDGISPQNSVEHSVNFAFDEVLGSSVTRNGLTLLGAQIVGDTNINGLFNFRRRASSFNNLMAAVDAVGGATQSIYAYNGSAWSVSYSSLTGGKRVRFETFLDNLIAVNGTDAAISFDSGSWASSGGALDIGNAPVGHFVKVYKDQLCIGHEDGTLYISSVPNTLGTAISWTSGNREIRVNPDDNQKMTGLGRIGTTLLIFKERGMFRFNNKSTDADLIIDVGASSQESIVTGGNALYFFNEKGIWMTRGDYPVRISRGVRKWIDGMSASYYESVSQFCDGEHLYCSIGDVTLSDGRSYSNVVLRYTLETHEWAVFSYAYALRSFAEYLSSDAWTMVAGDTTSRVFTVNSGNTDNGSSISYEIETHDQNFSSRGRLKEVSDRAILHGDKPVSAILQVKIDNGDWITIGVASSLVNAMIIEETLRGNFFKFRVIGTHASTPFRLKSVELPSVSLLDYV